jgi:hypothetical protein
MGGLSHSSSFGSRDSRDMRLLLHGLEAKQSISKVYRAINRALHAVKRSCAHYVHSLTLTLPLSLSLSLSTPVSSNALVQTTTKTQLAHQSDTCLTLTPACKSSARARISSSPSPYTAAYHIPVAQTSCRCDTT